LYCGIGGLLIVGARNQEHIRAALLLEAMFAGSLAAGRLISFAVDQHFHWFALLATGIEIPLSIICAVLFKNQANTAQKWV
jgi:Domain of unknown function (DUF4345)